MLIILGDRFEIFSAVQAAFFLNIKTVHIHGGEITEGVLDDSIRHSISKLSHLHFVTAQKHKQLLIKMGESPNTIFNVGAPGLDLIKKIKFITKNKLEEKLSLKFDKHIFLVTFHPLTLNIDDYLKGLNELFEALNFFKNTTIIFTYSNADVGGRRINGLIREYSSSNDNVKVYSSLGSQNYLSLMKISKSNNWKFFKWNN